ncbi:MAG: HU family DNA-binding protein [bacterium]|nr:HU family DNA-binding protein [bacterium]
MSKTTLIAALAEELGVSKKLAAELVNAFISIVINGVKKEGEVRIQGFGSFKASKRKAREGVNPQNPSQKIKIPAMKVVTFKAGSDFKKAVKKS